MEFYKVKTAETVLFLTDQRFSFLRVPERSTLFRSNLVDSDRREYNAMTSRKQMSDRRDVLPRSFFERHLVTSDIERSLISKSD